MLALLDERRVNLAQQWVRLVNQLHALLRDLLPGGAPTQLTADQAATLLRAVRPAGTAEQTRKQLARDLVADVRAVDARITDNTARMAEVVAATGSRLTTVDGIGPVLAARGPGPHRPPIPVRQRIAVRRLYRQRTHRSRQRRTGPPPAVARRRPATQRGLAHRRGHPGPDAHQRRPCLHERKIAEGKTRNEALRCLKRKLAEHLWRIMIKDEYRRQRQQDQTTGPGGHSGATLQSSATDPTPTASSPDKSLPRPADNQPTTTGNQAA
ncbi:MAG: family transposase [Dactylosporangium sp.]|nr:family transposase [Dactylosporangium sp.]